MLNYPDLSYERADHYIINYQKITNDRIFRVEGYYKEYDDLALMNADGLNYENAGNGYAKGIELFWRDKRTIKNGDYWISYSYLDTKRNWRNFQHQPFPTSRANTMYPWYTSTGYKNGGPCWEPPSLTQVPGDSITRIQKNLMARRLFLTSLLM